MDAPTPTAGETGPLSSPPDMVVPGRQFGPLRLVPSSLLFGVLAWMLVRGEAFGIPAIVILLLAVISLWGAAFSWFRPAKIELKQGCFSIFLGGAGYWCPASNVAAIGLAAKHVLVVFRDLDQVRPARLRAALGDRYQRQRFHAGGAPGCFTLEQVNQVRQALGMPPQAVDEAGDRIDQFRRVLRRLTPRVWATPMLVALDIAVFVAMVASGVGLLEPSLDDLIRWGANYGPKTLGGQSWRLASSMFVHVGLFHLLLNMWVLWDVGRLVERFVGNVGFLVAYSIAGITGSLASVWWHPHLVSAGASGAIFGVLGLLLGVLVHGRESIPAETYQALRGSVLAFLAFNLLFGFSVPGIDMAAHLGGLGAGCIAGLILGRPLSETGTKGRSLRNLALTVCGVVGLAIAAHALPAAPVDILAELSRCDRVERQVVAAYNEALKENHADRISHVEFADTVDRDVLAPWRAERARLAALCDSSESAAARLTPIVNYMKLRQEAWEALVEGLRTDNPAKLEEAQRKHAFAEAAAKVLEDGRLAP